MRYFLDTEFIEQPGSIQLISIGIKCQDGRKYYAISSGFEDRDADDWVRENVIDKLESNIPRLPISFIRQQVLDFIGSDVPEFWGYYADYDWVVFCWIFGKMIDLPDGWPMYCRDLKQEMDRKNIRCHIPKPEGEHNALVDAEWNERLHDHLKGDALMRHFRRFSLHGRSI